jgi:ankyrin repeat protein
MMKQILFNLILLSLHLSAQAAKPTNNELKLIAAAKNNDVMVVEALLDLDTDVNALSSDYNPMPALFYAAKEGHTEVVKILLESKADLLGPGHALLTNEQGYVNGYCDEGCRAFEIACERGHTQVVKLLLDAGANILASAYVTPLKLAVLNNRIGVVELLIKVKTKLEVKGKKTPLMIAAENNYTKIVKMLLQAGADVDGYANEEAKTAFLFAAEKGNIAIFNILKRHKKKLLKSRNTDKNNHERGVFTNDFSSDSSDDTLVDSASANKGINWSAEISNFIASFLMASMIF